MSFKGKNDNFQSNRIIELQKVTLMRTSHEFVDAVAELSIGRTSLDVRGSFYKASDSARSSTKVLLTPVITNPAYDEGRAHMTKLLRGLLRTNHEQIIRKTFAKNSNLFSKFL